MHAGQHEGRGRLRGEWGYGLVVGVMLSALRAPLGIDLLRIPGVDARISASHGHISLIGSCIPDVHAWVGELLG